MAPYVGAPEIKARRLVLTVEYHGQIGNPGLNVIRDLLHLEIDVTALLPADDSSAGFDNVSLGGLDPGRLERYLTAARKISRLAVGAPVRSAVADTFIVPSDLNQTGHIEGLPFGTRGGSTVRYNFPVDAEYDLRVELGKSWNSNSVGGLRPPPTS